MCLSARADPALLEPFEELRYTDGLDPNRWFFNVERVASERIGRETVEYVANIFKYYYAYLRVEQQRRMRDELKVLGVSEEGQQLLLHRDREHGTLPIPQARTILGL